MTAPILLRHRLRLQLRRHREGAALTQQQAARQLRWSASKLVRIEAGHIGLSYTDLRALLELYEVADSTVDELVACAEQSRRQPQWATYKDVVAAELLQYYRYEAAAVRLRAFSLGINELLQTADYARCMIQAVEPDTPARVVERLVELRLRRQELLYRSDAPTVHVLLDESALLRPPSTGEHARTVLQAQVQRLRELAELPHVDLRVVPVDRGHHPGIEHPFTAVDLPDGCGGVVHRLARPPASVILESAEDVAFHRRLFDWLTSFAISESYP